MRIPQVPAHPCLPALRHSRARVLAHANGGESAASTLQQRIGEALRHREHWEHSRGASRRRSITAPIRIGALALLLAGCSAERQPSAPVESGAEQAQSAPANTKGQRAVPALAVEAQGLRLFDRDTGSARPLAFGLARAQIMKALEFRRGEETGRNDDCGAGPLEFTAWPDGLTLYFEHARFAGWALGPRGDADAGGAKITTAAGIGLGSTRAELDSAYDAEVFTSSLGTEFAAGNLFGLLEGDQPTSRITHLWAGAGCVMR